MYSKNIYFPLLCLTHHASYHDIYFLILRVIYKQVSLVKFIFHTSYVIYSPPFSLFSVFYIDTVFWVLNYEVNDFYLSKGFSKEISTLLKCILSLAYIWREMVLPIRFGFNERYCFLIMCSDGLLYYLISKWWL